MVHGIDVLDGEQVRLQVGYEVGLVVGEHDLLEQVDFLKGLEEPLDFQLLREDVLGFEEILLLLVQLDKLPFLANIREDSLEQYPDAFSFPDREAF